MTHKTANRLLRNKGSGINQTHFTPILCPAISWATPSIEERRQGPARPALVRSRRKGLRWWTWYTFGEAVCRTRHSSKLKASQLVVARYLERRLVSGSKQDSDGQ